MPKYRTILVDPPWPSKAIGKMKGHGLLHKGMSKTGTPYGTMTMDDILSMPVGKLSVDVTHLWVWATNRFLHDAFHCFESWGFKYLYTFTWYKPSGVGAYMAVTTQFLLLGYRTRCIFNKKKWCVTHHKYTPRKHSAKPKDSYKLIESISDGPRVELFARTKRNGWDVMGNEVEEDLSLSKDGRNWVFAPGVIVV